MPFWLLLLGAGGAYWWWKQHQAPAAPAAPQLPPPPAPTATAGFNLVPDVVGPPTYGLTPNGVDELIHYGEYSDPHRHVQTMGYPMSPFVGATMVLAGDARPLPDGSSDNGMAAQAAVAAQAVPPSALPLAAIDWASLLSTAASVATLVTAVGMQPTPSEGDMIRWGLNSAGSQHVADLMVKFSHYPQAREMLSQRYSYLRSKGL